MAAVILLATSIFMWRAARDQARIATIQRAVAARQAIRANDAAVAAQNALTDSFFRTIGISKGDTLARDEREALWELSQLDRANALVRNDLLERAVVHVDASARVQARGGQGLRAATGLNLEYHRLAIRGASELGLNFAAALENPRETNSARLSSLGEALAALAAEMEPQAAAEVKRRAAQGLAAALENPQERDYTRLTRLRDALAALAAKMEPQAALEIAKGPCGSLGESAGKGYGAACALSALTNSQLYKMRWQVQRKKCSSSRLSSICELALLRKLYERSQVSSLDRGVRLRA
jgi:hypothetical protein